MGTDWHPGDETREERETRLKQELSTLRANAHAADVQSACILIVLWCIIYLFSEYIAPHLHELLPSW